MIVSYIEFPNPIVYINKEFYNISKSIIEVQKNQAKKDVIVMINLLNMKYEIEYDIFCDIYKIENVHDTELLNVFYKSFFENNESFNKDILKKMDSDIEQKTKKKSKYFYDRMYEEMINMFVLSESNSYDISEIFQQNKVFLHIIKILVTNGYNIYMKEEEYVRDYNDEIKYILEIKNIFEI